MPVLLWQRWLALALLLGCWPPAARAQLLWEPEPEARQPAAATPMASGLRWEADDGPPPALATGPSAKPAPESGPDPAPERPAPLTPDELAVLLREPYSPPNLGGGLPSAYVANWGDFYVFASAGTPGKREDNQPDGAVGAGIGFGNDQELIAIELNWGIGSIRNFNDNGALNLLAGRTLINAPRFQLLLGGGVLDLYAYGNERPQPDPTGFGVITMAMPLREPNFEFNQVLQISAGVGGRDFVALDSSFQGSDVSAFGAVGVELAPNLGVSAGISGRGTNFNLSYSPFRELPITLNLLAADVFDQSPFGTVGVLTLSWGDNFRRGLF